MSGSWLRSKLRSSYDAVVSAPMVNKVQTSLLGRDTLTDALAPVVAATTDELEHGVVIDLGGGTAQYRHLWPTSWRYCCVDPDERVIGFNDTAGPIEHITGSAEQVPLEDGCADQVFMAAVSHHLDDDAWPRALAEVRRLVKPSGSFIFVDGVLGPRLKSRIGWRFDVGKHPRTSESLEAALATLGPLTRIERMSLLHDVIIAVIQVDSSSPMSRS